MSYVLRYIHLSDLLSMCNMIMHVPVCHKNDCGICHCMSEMYDCWYRSNAVKDVLHESFVHGSTVSIVTGCDHIL